MRRLKLIFSVLRETGAGTIMISFIAFMLLCSIVIWLCEPGIATWGEALWYCFAASSTIGFGDVVVHTTLSRILTVILSICAAITLAIFTGVLVSAFNQMVELRQKDSLTAIAERLDQLPNMSREELRDLSERIRRRMKM